MSKKISASLLLIFNLFLLKLAGDELQFTVYHSPQEINKILKNFVRKFPKNCKLVELTRSPGGNEVFLLEIRKSSEDKYKPAILVVANPEGRVPLSSEAALMLIDKILREQNPLQNHNWYFIVSLNPDAHQRFFLKPQKESSLNFKSVNRDLDDQSDEDDAEDLNGDGIITEMRVKDLEGEWVESNTDPRIMRRADPEKGERGIYKIYEEGTDNDADGQINEDGRGGVNVGVNFPHLFKFFVPDNGRWAGSETETYNLMKYVYDHPEIALVLTFGAVNFCYEPPRSDRRGDVDFNRIKIPKRIGRFMNIDTERTYTMAEIMEYAKKIVPPGFEITETMVASFLELGAVVNPLPADMKFYQKISEKYKEFLKEKKLDQKRLDPEKDKDGSVELWAYYHLGLPSFALDFWTPPVFEEPKKETPAEGLTAEKVEQMSNEEFIALGEEKIAQFLKESEAPANLQPAMLINALKGGMLTTKKMAEMMRQMRKKNNSNLKDDLNSEQKSLLKYADSLPDRKGLLQWQKIQHPKFGQAEIGGFTPYLKTTPPAGQIESILRPQIEWPINLVNFLPKIKFLKSEVKKLSAGLFQVSVWVENSSLISYPTAMGERNERIKPIVLEIKSDQLKIIEGKKRSLIRKIEAYDVQKVSWIIQTSEQSILKIDLITQNCGTDSIRINLGGVQ